jgi:predicted transport protein
MGLTPSLQTRLYEEFWRPMELDFGQEAYGTQFDGFMRHYLTVRTGDIPRESDVYEAFKEHAFTRSVKEAGIEALVKDIRSFARYYCAIALGRETDSTLATAFHDLRELKVEVAYPFLLELYDDYAGGRLSVADFVAAVQLVESYVFRRAICSIPTNSMNKTFATFGKALKKDRYLESIKAHFLTLPTYRRFPGDDEFRRDLQIRDLYNFRSRSYWLRRLENHGRKERVPVDEYTIEHILPQNPDLPVAWQQALGPDWKSVQEQWLHTLGNLTLTGYNAEYSDRSFIEKRDMKGGFKQSPLKLNADLGQVHVWNETAIRQRAGKLADQALLVWAVPVLEVATLEAYRSAKKESRTVYTIDDHPNLLTPTLRPLYEEFRRQVLALDPNVSEEFFKKYVAYKAETNFVDVIPQAKRLRLFLNMPFPEINDPKKKCKDYAGIGHWGNGDVRVYLESFEDLPYIMGLVRQSFECQMGDASKA